MHSVAWPSSRLSLFITHIFLWFICLVCKHRFNSFEASAVELDFIDVAEVGENTGVYSSTERRYMASNIDHILC